VSTLICLVKASDRFRADPQGLLAVSFFTLAFNAFKSDPKTVISYGTINLILGLLGSYLPFQAWFTRRSFKVSLRGLSIVGTPVATG
jgi:hypothetical protein